ncbi:MAG: hypothetical protein JWO57_3200, partial [Pseudonocardiales bacterium]|nr:hypothetical protein [Pseudonocardiales bacterium]
VDPILAANEPDEEVQDLLRASPGLNLGVDFLPGALDVDPRAVAIDAKFAGRVLWFDALIGNVDRSWRNPNMLLWHGVAYLIDHGASLTFHHDWSRAAASARYDAREHALLGCAPDVAAADRDLAPRVTAATLAAATDEVPDAWLAGEPGFAGVAELRAAYVARLSARLDARAEWLADLRTAIAAHGEGARVAPRPKRPAWLETRP